MLCAFYHYKPEDVRALTIADYNAHVQVMEEVRAG